MLNFYEFIKNKSTHNPGYDTHKIALPFRMLVCCQSGAGKSNFVLNLIRLMDRTFTEIIIVTKAEETLYNHLIEKVQGVKIYYYHEDGIPQLQSSDTNKLIVFDDLVTIKDKAIDELFIRGRKMNYSSIYISQSYFMTPKLIRQNISYLALGRGISASDINLILREYSVSIPIEQLKKLYHDITAERMSFMLFDFDNLNIRKNFLDIVWSRELPAQSV